MDYPVLYHDPTSEPSRAVHWFAVEAEIELSIKHTWLTRGDHQASEFLDINPTHQVPAIKHGEFCLAEASAIMIYLAEINGVQNRWIGESPEDRAKTIQFLSWHHTNTRLSITLNYFLPALLMPAYIGMQPPGAATVQQLREAGKESLKMLNNLILTQGAYLGGEEPSMADFFIASDLFALDIDPAKQDWFSDCPVVSDWLGRLRSRNGYRSSHLQWDSIVPKLQQLISSESDEQRNPGWVADFIENQYSD